MAATVDLRSDTVTRPTGAMRRAMAEAEVGDDGYGEDPTVRRLEAVVAERLGTDTALFVPSGTMGNQIAMRLLAQPGDLVVVGRQAHVVAYEDGAAGRNSGVVFAELDDDDGRLAPDDVNAVIDGSQHHLPRPVAVCVENTHMPSGGSVWPVARMDEVAALGLPVHLDGARLFNAEVAAGIPVERWARTATTVSICLSKGLGAPVGSVLGLPAELRDRARRERKRLGGGLRQAGVLAAAGLVAVESMVDRLADDHRRAAALANAVRNRWSTAAVRPADGPGTNVVVFRHPDPEALLAHLGRAGIVAGTIAPETVRLVTHLDVDDAGIERTLAALAEAP